MDRLVEAELVRSRMETLRRLFAWQLVVLLVVALAASAHADNPKQSGQSQDSPPDSTSRPGDAAIATPPATGTPSLTVTGKVPRNEPTLPRLPPDQFTECYAKPTKVPKQWAYRQ